MLLQCSEGNGDKGVRQLIRRGFELELAGECAGPALPELGEWEEPHNGSRERREETQNQCISVRITALRPPESTANRWSTGQRPRLEGSKNEKQREEEGKREKWKCH